MDNIEKVIFNRQLIGPGLEEDLNARLKSFKDVKSSGSEGQHLLENIELLQIAANNPFHTGPFLLEDSIVNDKVYNECTLTNHGAIFHVTYGNSYNYFQPVNSLFFAGPMLGDIATNFQQLIRNILLENLHGTKEKQIFPLIDEKILAEQSWRYRWETEHEIDEIYQLGKGVHRSVGGKHYTSGGTAYYLDLHAIRYYGREYFNQTFPSYFWPHYDEIRVKIERASIGGNKYCLDTLVK